MKNRVALWIMFTLLLASMILVSRVRPFETIETIYINADGTVSPSNAPIQQNGNVYTLTDNIAAADASATAIIIQKDSIVLDGAGYTLKGTGSATGIELSGRQGVTIEHLEIRDFDEGISLSGGALNTITRTNLTDNKEGIYLNSSVVSISRSNIESNGFGIYADNGSGWICQNYIAHNSEGLHIQSGFVYHNSFANNEVQARIEFNVGRLARENYWSDYNGTDDNGDSIGDTPYTVDVNNTDVSPLMLPWEAIHDVTITNLTHRTVVDQGKIDYENKINKGIINETMINVAAKNRGIYNETFDVTVYYGNGTVTPEMWDAFARVGDINRDGYINKTDVDIVAACFGAIAGSSKWNPNCDLNGDWKVDMKDVGGCAKNSGKAIWSYFNLSSDIIGTQQVTDLAPRSSMSLTFTLNTTGLEYQNYTTSAYAQPNPNETETTDNTLASSTVVTIPGDINGDFTSSLADLVDLTLSYPITPGVPPLKWNPNADIDGRGTVNLIDLVILAQNYDRKLYEHCTAGDDGGAAVNSSDWYAQTFTVGTSDETITSVKLEMYQVGSPGAVTVSIRATDVNGDPTGQDLTSGTIDGNGLGTSSPGHFYDIRLTKYTLSANTKYAIVMRAPSGDPSNYVVWRMASSSLTYKGGSCEYSSDSGADWNAFNGDFMFAVWEVYL